MVLGFIIYYWLIVGIFELCLACTPDSGWLVLCYQPVKDVFAVLLLSDIQAI